ncbi:hypothetical protein GCM10023081_46780 [Arthrobacter ginkgonis]|uniref:Minor capsid protein n=1 Tax=Arthrobacter ginkgonis TaxID=1630594 RepID=A0ABP7DGK1_9MICC
MTQGASIKINPRVRDIVNGAAVRGLTLAAEHALGEANKNVPIEEGTLERSGYTTVDPGGLQAAISYDTPYAVRQHEDMSLRHDDGRTAKWLENAVNAEAQNVRDIIAGAIRKDL